MIVDLDVGGAVRGATLAGVEPAGCPASLEVGAAAVGGARPLYAAPDDVGLVLGVEQLGRRRFEAEGLCRRRPQLGRLSAECSGVVRWDAFEAEQLGASRRRATGSAWLPWLPEGHLAPKRATRRLKPG